MPYPNEHACRLRDPKDLRIVGSDIRDHDGKKYRIIFGKPKGADGSVEQAYHYPKDTWIEAEARKHCEEHNGIMFEPASASQNQNWHQNAAYFCPQNQMIEEDGVLKIPTVFTKEGVQNKGFKSREELQKSARWLNNRPVVINHPTRWPGVVREDTPIYGFTSDVHYEEDSARIFGITNLELTGAPPEIVQGIRERKIKAGSVGYWSLDISAPPDSKWNGVPFSFYETNLLFDHYAILPDQDGACSVSEGCGFQANRSQSSSHGDTDVETGRHEINQSKTKGEKNMSENKDAPKTVEELEQELAKLKTDQDKLVDQRVANVRTELEAKQNELTLKETELKQTIGQRDSLLAKLNAMVKGERERLDTARNSLIGEIVALTGEHPEAYKNWDVAQLQKVCELLKSNQVDRFAKAPRDFASLSETPGLTLGSPNDVRTAKNWAEK
jgi:hypothetical protein